MKRVTMTNMAVRLTVTQASKYFSLAKFVVSETWYHFIRSENDWICKHVAYLLPGPKWLWEQMMSERHLGVFVQELYGRKHLMGGWSSDQHLAKRYGKLEGFLNKTAELTMSLRSATSSTTYCWTLVAPKYIKLPLTMLILFLSSPLRMRSVRQTWMSNG